MKTGPSTPMQMAKKIVEIANILDHDKTYELCKFETLRQIYKIVKTEEFFPNGFMNWITGEIVSNELPNNSSGSTISALLDVDNFLENWNVEESVEKEINEFFNKAKRKLNKA